MVFVWVAMVGVASGEGAYAGGVAICIAMEKSGLVFTDVEYFLRYDRDPETTGWDARRAARRDHDAKYGGRPYCRSSASNLTKGGRFVVIKGGRTRDALGGSYARWALGFGSTLEVALDDALKVLRARDRLWVESQHGYSVVEQGTF
ncbi:MAG: hypothetical protein OXI79_19315 [Gammaproteobacteria bacterium]|nr:hypothetical protein [Gammaproteobacteria bacterium]